jgi:hypothetical protein
MIVSVFRRRLRTGRTFEEFEAAWVADEGFGVPARVFNARSLTDEREILTFGFVDIGSDELAAAVERVAGPEAVRHRRIDDLIESTELRGFYELLTEHDFTDDPVAVRPGSEASLLAPLLEEAPAPDLTAE